MTSFFVSFMVFLLALTGHVASHRYFARRGERNFAVVLWYAVGLVVLIAFVLLSMVPMPVMSLVLYALLSMVTILFYLTPFLGGETPASMILESFETKPQQSYADIRLQFTDYGLIGKRLADLTKAGMIRMARKRYYVTKKGSVWMQAISVYEIVFCRKLTG